MNQLQANAVQVIERATALERQGALADAHKAYEDGVRILQSILVVEGSKMSPLAREQLMAYMQRVEAKVLALRQRLPAPSVLASAHHKDPTTVARSSSSLLDDISSLSTTDKKGSVAQPPPHKPPQVDVPPSTSPTPSSAKATPPPPPSSAADAGLPLLPALPAFKAAPSHVGKKSPAAPKASQDSTPPPAAAPAPKDVPDSQPLHYIPPDQKQPTRTSAVVMRAIELATQLSKEKKFKQAVDVLQHAYDAGRMEGNNPSNFNKVHDLILDLRRRYYEAFKPRFFQDNGVTKEEMELLRRSGQTKSILLPMWDDVGDGYAAENVYLPCKGDSWEDAFTPYISQKQKASACILERFPRLVSNPALLQVYHEADPMNIKQTVVGDCSLVCSLIVCTNFQKRFPQYNLISGVIFPQDASGKPIVSPKGKYCVKMLVNGITRMVVVDDRIPVSRTMQPPPPPSPVTSLVATLPVSPTATPQPGEAAAPSTTTPDAASAGETVRFLKHPLCTYSRNPAEMWVCIIEKAFVKVCGGSYDFPGSNSSVDMFKLSGWLPDGFHFDGEDVDLELQWRRLLVNHNRGAVLATISTPQNLSKEVEEKLKLVPGHAYAILSILDQDGRRLVKIKNPWARQSWEGLYSLNDKQWPQELLAALAFTPQEAEQGVFWMSWADVCRYYKRCNLSWNPYLLFAPPPSDTTPRRPNRLAVHGVLTFSDSFAESPQYHLMVRDLPKPARVHIVLARHILDLAKEYANRADDMDDSPLIALQVFDVTATPTVAQILAGRGASGNPSCVGGSCMARLVAHGSELHGGDDARVFKGVYKNVEAQTVSFNCPGGNSDLVLVVSLYKGVRGASFPFSLFVHTDVGIGTTGPRAAIHRIPPPAPHAPPEDVASHSKGTLTSVFEGMWKSGSTCGGKNDSQTFVYNPQYQLTLSAPSHVTVYLNAPWNKDSVQLQLVRKRVQQPPTNSHPWVQRVDAIQSRTCDIVLQSPMYCNGSVVVDTAIGACLAFDTTGTLKTPVGPAPPPISAVPPPSPPPPPLLSGPKPIQVNVPKASKSFSIAEAPSSLPAAALIIVGALANALLATPSHSKVVFRGAAIAVDGVSGESGKHKTLAELGDCNEPFVLLLNTEELQRTQPLQLLVVKLYEEAKLAIALVEALAKALRAPPPRDCSSTVSECKHAAERITQLLTKLDDVQCPSDPIRTTRKAVIMACHVLHDLMDGMIVAACSGGGGTSSPVPMPPAAPAIAVEPPLNQLPAGIYTLIPSTWSKGSASPFSIWLTTTAPHQVQEIPAEGSEWKSAVLQSQFRGAAPPSADVFFATAPGQRCALPPQHPLFATQACATICAPRSGCQFTCRLMTIEGNPQQERSSVGVCLALFAVLGSGEVAGGAHRRMELVHVTSYTNSSCCIEPTPLVAQQPYVLVAMSAAPSNLPIVLRCFGSSEFTAKVNN